MAELVDAIDLGSIVLGRASSILAPGTNFYKFQAKMRPQKDLAIFPELENKLPR